MQIPCCDSQANFFLLFFCSCSWLIPTCEWYWKSRETVRLSALLLADYSEVCSGLFSSHWQETGGQAVISVARCDCLSLSLFFSTTQSWVFLVFFGHWRSPPLSTPLERASSVMVSQSFWRLFFTAESSGALKRGKREKSVEYPQLGSVF